MHLSTRKSEILVLLILSAATLSVRADAYSIQIGAFQDPTLANTAAANDFGKVSTHVGQDGLTRFYLGEFSDEASAGEVATQLQGRGYAGAFVVGRGQRAENAQEASSNAFAENSKHRGEQLSAAREKLPAFQHANIVYLDGRLMLKDGDAFHLIK